MRSKSCAPPPPPPAPQVEMTPVGTLDRGCAPAADTSNTRIQNLTPLGNVYSNAPDMGLFNHSQRVGMLREKVHNLELGPIQNILYNIEMQLQQQRTCPHMNIGSSPNTHHSVPQNMYFSQQPHMLQIRIVFILCFLKQSTYSRFRQLEVVWGDISVFKIMGRYPDNRSYMGGLVTMVLILTCIHYSLVLCMLLISGQGMLHPVLTPGIMLAPGIRKHGRIRA